MVQKNKKYNIDTIDLIIKKAIHNGWSVGGILKPKEKPDEIVLEAIINYLKNKPMFYFDKTFGRAFWGSRHFLKPNGTGGQICPKCHVSFYGGAEKNNDNECLYWHRKMEKLVLEDDHIKFLSKYL